MFIKMTGHLYDAMTGHLYDAMTENECTLRDALLDTVNMRFCILIQNRMPTVYDKSFDGGS